MEQISGLQSILADMHRQYVDGSMPFEQYSTNVNNLREQSPEMFQEAVATPMVASNKFDMALPSMSPNQANQIDFTNSTAQRPGPGPNQQMAANSAEPGSWENFAGMLT